jgi:hypothetical protein
MEDLLNRALVEMQTAFPGSVEHGILIRSLRTLDGGELSPLFSCERPFAFRICGSYNASRLRSGPLAMKSLCQEICISSA